MLRQNHYSIAAIQRSLALYDSGNHSGAILRLNQPAIDNEIEYVSAGDHWLDTLSTLSISSEKIKQIVMNKHIPTLQLTPNLSPAFPRNYNEGDVKTL
ncbi:hypothetical protein B9T62_20785 [Paenibacillus donghaensis]|uniref:Uncharacterized protein n=1 Tax=Paenibacillus donghaensis TaxID=414771 RepID=A0A2Z2KTW7_9BACL|nr:hypothetical protein B9T62_20785 [Paenibacillus donghaensis]